MFAHPYTQKTDWYVLGAKDFKLGVSWRDITEIFSEPKNAAEWLLVWVAAQATAVSSEANSTLQRVMQKPIEENEPRRTQGAIVRFDNHDYIVIESGRHDKSQMQMNTRQRLSICSGDEFVRWATHAECIEFDIPFIQR